MQARVGNFSINYVEDTGSLDTYMPLLGVTIHALPQDNPAYRITSSRLGYGLNVGKMNRDHDTMHCLMAHWLGLGFSPALSHLALNQDSDEYTDAEEDMVLAIQRYANMMGVDIFKLAQRIEYEAAT